MNFKRLFDTDLGKIFISILLGLGLASLFRKVCNDKNCIVFNGPVLQDFENKIYKYDEKCYKYATYPAPCNLNKKIIDVSSSLPSPTKTQ